MQATQSVRPLDRVGCWDRVREEVQERQLE